MALNYFFVSVNWSLSLIFKECITVNDAVDLFYSKLMLGIHSFVPKKVHVKKSHPSWYNRRLLNLKNIQTKLHSKYSSSKCAEDYQNYSTARREFKYYQNLLYHQHIRHTQDTLKKDPCRFWEYVNSKKKSIGYPRVMYRGDIKAYTTSGICELFADFFF